MGGTVAARGRGVGGEESGDSRHACSFRVLSGRGGPETPICLAVRWAMPKAHGERFSYNLLLRCRKAGRDGG